MSALSFPGIASGDFGILALGLVLTGAASGFVAGVLGLGEGVVIVPVLYHVLATLGVSASVRMHVAVGTSLAATVPASFASVTARGNNSIDWTVGIPWAAPALLGAILGSVLAGIASDKLLSLVFGIAALAVTAFLVSAGAARRFSDHPQGVMGWMLAMLIGGASAMTGIGGRTLGAPLLSALGLPKGRAIGAASLFGIIVSITGTIGAVVIGWKTPALPPWSPGYVNLLGFLLIAPPLFFATPFGAEIADAVDVKRIRFLFAAFVMITTGRMLFDALG